MICILSHKSARWASSLAAACAICFATASGQETPTAALPIGWTDNSSNEDGFRVYASTSIPTIDAAGKVLELPDRFLVAEVAADEVGAAIELPVGALYHVAALAFNGFGESGYTNAIALDFRPPDGDPSGLGKSGPVVTTVSGSLRVTGDLVVDGRILSQDTDTTR